MIDKETYKLKISNATPQELTIITYDLLIDFLNESILNKDESVKYLENNKSAQKALRELMVSLDMQYEISINLMEIYVYVNKLIINASFKYNEDNIKEAIKLISKLKEGFESISDSSSEKVMDNVDKVYAGLTYKDGQLSEYIDTKENKGFKI